ncbi:relaxase/mobilization nuclease domain-containing protein [Agathobaculum butyriciproducens]
MAVIKAVSSRAGIKTILNYVMKEEKTEKKLLSCLNCTPDMVQEQMEFTKRLWGKNGGRTYKHFVQSFAPEENIDPVQAHQIACQLAASRPEWQDFEVLIATHEDKKHIHTHFVVNSVSCVDGHKIQQSKAELQAMKDDSDRLCMQHGLHITEKGKTFDGHNREETAAFSKDTYQMLKKAEQGEVKSYVQDIALAILKCREQATSRADFVQHMNEQGYGVDWQDSHKYITFIDLNRQTKGEKQCKIRNNKLEKYYNMNFGKEALEHEFASNARTAETPREQFNRTASSGEFETFIANLALTERAAAAKSRDSVAQREDREHRAREQLAACRRADEGDRETEKDQRGVREDSRRRIERDRGIEKGKRKTTENHKRSSRDILEI